ncbi:hypothetical protein [Clostridium sp. IBUN22A]|uniref:hypothetical protein n=1 Tax=Clostridium sp. IBUN22A TaxID=1523155 RepID=UPI001FA73034|nr:hypothetical protein [Clostridium sp. IBUN22A]
MLIIDDEVEIVELMEVYLVNEGYKVFKAYNGNDGINIIYRSARSYYFNIRDVLKQ